MASALAEADLIFPNRAHRETFDSAGAARFGIPGPTSLPTLNQLRSDLKRSNLSIANRLRSIREDSLFVEAVCAAYGRPLVANERCGSWYVDPRWRSDGTELDEEVSNNARKASRSEAGPCSAYFKSTDGHTGQWKFSTRRLNLHLLEVIGKNDGCIIVDSTRRGKSMPDALSKTIPIWCAVLNRVLFPSSPAQHALHLPPSVISASEHSQIEKLLPELAASLLRINLDLSTLRAHLTKPLRPLWVTPETSLPEPSAEGPFEIFEDFHPVICCTASRRISASSELGAGGYIQGAADDTENWARGLTPDLFWANLELLLQTSEGELAELVDKLVASPRARLTATEDSEATDSLPRPIQLTRRLAVGVLGARRRQDADCEIVLLPEPKPSVGSEVSDADRKADLDASSSKYLEVGLGQGKIASRNLRRELPGICKFATKYLSRKGVGDQETSRIVIRCESGRNLSVGVALALFCHCFDDQGNTLTSSQQHERQPWNKDAIRTKLGKVMTAMPGANPSRSTLQSVNSFLMDWHT